jgi:excinuclease UvrABC helicase subunit UvrB
MENFELVSNFKPTQDQQIAIDKLYGGLNVFKNQTKPFTKSPDTAF